MGFLLYYRRRYVSGRLLDDNRLGHCDRRRRIHVANRVEDCKMCKNHRDKCTNRNREDFLKVHLFFGYLL